MIREKEIVNLLDLPVIHIAKEPWHQQQRLSASLREAKLSSVLSVREPLDWDAGKSNVSSRNSTRSRNERTNCKCRHKQPQQQPIGHHPNSRTVVGCWKEPYGTTRKSWSVQEGHRLESSFRGKVWVPRGNNNRRREWHRVLKDIMSWHPWKSPTATRNEPYGSIEDGFRKTWWHKGGTTSERRRQQRRILGVVHKVLLPWQPSDRLLKVSERTTEWLASWLEGSGGLVPALRGFGYFWFVSSHSCFFLLLLSLFCRCCSTTCQQHTHTHTNTLVCFRDSEPKIIAPEHDYSKRPLQLFWLDGLALQAISETKEESILFTQVDDDDEDEEESKGAEEDYPLKPPVASVGDFKTTPAIHAGYAATWFGLSGAGIYMTRKLITRGRGWTMLKTKGKWSCRWLEWNRIEWHEMASDVDLRRRSKN